MPRIAALALAVLALSAVPAGANVVSWGTPVQRDDQEGFVGLSCPSPTCFAADSGGRVLSATDPAGAWTPQRVGDGLLDLACSAAGPCVAAAGDRVYASTAPQRPGSWQAKTLESPTGAISASCTSDGACLAVGGESTSPDSALGRIYAWTGGAWQETQVPLGPHHGGFVRSRGALESVACPSRQFCVVGDDRSEVLVSTDPFSAAPTWQTEFIDTDPIGGSSGIDSYGELGAVACPAACYAADDGGALLSAPDPLGAWTRHQISELGGGLARNQMGLACPFAHSCLGWYGDTIYASDTPAQPGSWLTQRVDPAHTLTGIACPTTTRCLAVDDAGNVIVGVRGSLTWSRLRRGLRHGITRPRITFPLRAHTAARQSVPAGGSLRVRWLLPVPQNNPILLAVGRARPGRAGSVRLVMSRVAGIPHIPPGHWRVLVETRLTIPHAAPATVLRSYHYVVKR